MQVPQPVLLKNISLNIRENEIVAIAGVSGNGQRELAEILNGLRQWKSGSLKFEKFNNSKSAMHVRVSGNGLCPHS